MRYENNIIETSKALSDVTYLNKLYTLRRCSRVYTFKPSYGWRKKAFVAYARDIKYIRLYHILQRREAAEQSIV